MVFLTTPGPDGLGDYFSFDPEAVCGGRTAAQANSPPTRCSASYSAVSVTFSHLSTGGRSWLVRYTGSGCGRFIDLLPFAGKLLALTDKDVYCSTTGGRSWLIRSSSSIAQSLVSLQDGGRELIGMTADGHIYTSTTEGASWLRRR